MSGDDLLSATCHISTRLYEEDLLTISRPFLVEEVNNALFSMRPIKAPGLDGYNDFFFPKKSGRW